MESSLLASKTLTDNFSLLLISILTERPQAAATTLFAASVKSDAVIKDNPL